MPGKLVKSEVGFLSYAQHHPLFLVPYFCMCVFTQLQS